MRSYDTSIRLWLSFIRMNTFVVPVMLDLCNEEVMTYVESSLFPTIALKCLGLANREPAKLKEQ